MSTVDPRSDQLLGRRLDVNTMTWRAPGLTPIPAEVMDGITWQGASVVDLLFLLKERDRIAEALYAQKELE
jgi:hypothetical protein